MFCKNCGTKIPDDAQFCPFCGEVLEMDEKRLIEAQNLDNKFEDDFDIRLDWVSETSVIRQDMRTRIVLQVAKITSAPVDGAKVQLSGPPQVDIVIKSRKIHPRKTTNSINFPISAEEPGLFTLTATLTSNAGHRIAFPFKIRVEPTKTLYGGKTHYPEETRVKPATYNPPSRSSNDNLVAARVIFGIIGVVLLIAAAVVTYGGFGGYGGYGSTLPFVISLAVIGVVILAIVTKGICCYAGIGCGDCSSCDCGDCDCDC
ncbi:MAG: zinc-ribbon domain-containing protein [Promethearchaeota archaeon]